MIKAQWEKLAAKIDGMSIRERAMIFAAMAVMLLTLITSFFIDPLWSQQKKLAAQVIQKQEKMKEIQAQLEALLQAKKDDDNSPLRERVKLIKQELKEGEVYLKSRRDKLVPPEKMAELLDQVLSKNKQMQLVSLETLPVTPLIESSSAKPDGGVVTVKSSGQEKQVYKHGFKITLRGSYADLTRYLTELEQLKTQMFWGSAKMRVNQYPQVELTVTLYTLSLDMVWLQV